MIPDPIVRDDARVVMAHDALPQIIDAVLVVPLVHLRHGPLRVRLVGEAAEVVVLPEIVQAVEMVGPACDGYIAACC